MRILKCTIVVIPNPQDDLPVPVSGTLRVRILDVGRQDVASTLVAGVEINDVTLTPGQQMPVELRIDVDSVTKPHPQLSVEAHLDQTGSGQTSVGDYRTMIHVAVELVDLDTDSDLIVPVRRVD